MPEYPPTQASGGTDPESKNPPQADGQKPEPKIRTMKSDIAEFMKETKPSLIQILTKQVEYQPAEPAGDKKPFPFMAVMVSIVAFAVVGGAGWFSYQYLASRQAGVAGPEISEETVPASPVAVEKTETVITGATMLQLQKALFDASGVPERSGALKRLVIKIKKSGGGTRLLTPTEFFDILGVHPPPQIPDSLHTSLFLYIYYTGDGPRSVLLAPSRDTGRTFAGMLGWENSIQRDLEILFLGARISPIIAPFIDRTFQNIDYRFLEIEKGLGIGYFIFSVKNMLVLSTSEEALQVVISRLFEAR